MLIHLSTFPSDNQSCINCRQQAIRYVVGYRDKCPTTLAMHACSEHLDKIIMDIKERDAQLDGGAWTPFECCDPYCKTHGQQTNET